MTADLKPYPHYKPSGVDWLGDIPAHWEVRRLKFSVENVADQTRKRRKREIYLAMEHVESWTGKYSEAGPDVVFDSQVKRFKAGDVLFGKLRPYLAKVTRPNRTGVCVGEFLVLRPRACALSSGYLEYLMRSKPVIDAINASTFGAKMPRADWQFIGGMVQPLPPLAEQAAIVRYLDHTDGRIRRYLRSRERLIELLKEYRQATIHETVTQGLDPDVPLKPSGAEWLGDIPAHWEVRRVKHAFRRIVGGSTPSSSEAAYWDGTIVWVTPTDISKVTRLRDSQRRITKKGFDSCSTTLVPVGSLVVTSRAPVGNVALAEVPLCTNQGCKTLVPDSQVIDSTYGYQVFGRLKDELQSLANGTTFTEISTNALGNVLLPIPPLASKPLSPHIWTNRPLPLTPPWPAPSGRSTC